MTTDFLQATDSAVLQEVIYLLSNHFKTPVQIGSVDRLSEPSRRNLILRITLQNPINEMPESLILKQSLASDSNDNDQDILERSARDWAGLEFLNGLKIFTQLVPKFYGGSQKHRFVLIEDLGKVHISLVDSLTGSDRNAAEVSLKRHMKVMGQFHGNGHAHIQDYNAILKNLNPNAQTWQDDFDDMTSKISVLLEKFGVAFTEQLQHEIHQVFSLIKEPGPFTTLIHGDICPDNVFDNPINNQMQIIDFEWGFIGNALLDGTYLRMSNPTCWCVKAFPDDIIEPLEKIYRNFPYLIPIGNQKIIYEDRGT